MLYKKPICILGGMGPDASAKLYSLLIFFARENFGAVKNEDYPEIILHSVPVPDFISSLDNIDIATMQLKKHIAMINQYEGNIGIACNTAHLFLPELSQIAENSQFTSIPEEVAKELVKREMKRVGILASPVTIYSGIYQRELIEKGIASILPELNDIDELGNIILDIVSGNFKPSKKKLLNMADTLKRKKAQAIILGCTELSLVFPRNYSLPIFDSMEVLANALLKQYYNKEEI